MPFADSLDQEVAALKLFIEGVPAFLRERMLAAAKAGDTAARDAYRMAQTIALESGIYLVNSLVDGALLILANRTRGTDLKAGDMGRYRYTLQKEIETRLGLKLNTLNGWSQVDKIKRDANSLKHRLGLAFAKGTDAPLDITDEVNPSQAQLLDNLIGARAWLRDIDTRLS